MREIINAADNVTIAPSDVVEQVSRIIFIIFFTEFLLCQKRRAIENGLEGGEDEEGEDDEGVEEDEGAEDDEGAKDDSDSEE